MPITDALEQAILHKASDSEIRQIALSEGMFSLRMSAIEKMKLGFVDLEEVFAVTSA
jgi:type IV pilus assembly protein PilB